MSRKYYIGDWRMVLWLFIYPN